MRKYSLILVYLVLVLVVVTGYLAVMTHDMWTLPTAHVSSGGMFVQSTYVSYDQVVSEEYTNFGTVVTYRLDNGPTRKVWMSKDMGERLRNFLVHHRGGTLR